jgi:hypothetical protein
VKIAVKSSYSIIKTRLWAFFAEPVLASVRTLNCWPAPEISQNVNTKELGNLGLTTAEEAAIVAFLKTLSDGFIRGSRGKHLR